MAERPRQAAMSASRSDDGAVAGPFQKGTGLLLPLHLLGNWLGVGSFAGRSSTVWASSVDEGDAEEKLMAPAP